MPRRSRITCVPRADGRRVLARHTRSWRLRSWTGRGTRRVRAAWTSPPSCMPEHCRSRKRASLRTIPPSPAPASSTPSWNGPGPARKARAGTIHLERRVRSRGASFVHHTARTRATGLDARDRPDRRHMDALPRLHDRRRLAESCGLAPKTHTHQGRFVTLRITARTDLADDKLETRVSIRNSGNDDARNVRVGVGFGGRATRSDAIVALDHDTEREVVLAVPSARLADGEWPLRVRVDYQDTNGYPFQALHVGTVPVGSCRPPGVGVSEVGIVRLESNGSASLSFCVGNAGDQPRTVSMRIEISDDLGRAAAPEPMQ